MEVGLITLGGILIIASFEIQFRYLAMAKQYYDSILKKISIDIDELIKNKKSKSENQDDPKFSKFLDDLNKLLSKFTIEKDKANFPNHLFIGFISMGIYIILLGLIYDILLDYYNNPPTPTTDPNSIFMFVFIFAMIPSIPILKGLVSLRRITRIS